MKGDVGRRNGERESLLKTDHRKKCQMKKYVCQDTICSVSSSTINHFGQGRALHSAPGCCDKPGGHHVVPVDDLDEGAHRRAAEDLLVGHRLGDTAGRAADTSNEAVAVAAALRAVKALHDDSLLARIAAVQKDNNLAGLEAVWGMKESAQK